MVSCLLYMAMAIPLLKFALTMLRTGAQYAVHADSTETLPSGRTGHPSHFVLIPKCMNYRLQMA